MTIDQAKTKILIVDDRQENLINMENILAELEVELVTAKTGREALSHSLNHEFALVLLDVQMPGMDGYETAELMRGNDSTKFMPIIFVTAERKELQHVFKGYEAGAVDYLTKPIDPVILRSKTKVFIDLYNQRKMLERTIHELHESLEEVKTLQGIIPICSHCKQIRDDKGFWEQVESYISKRTEAQFSHGICPKCVKKHYSDLT